MGSKGRITSFRYPRTTGLIRAICAAKADGEIKMRKALRQVPTAYDDIERRRGDHRCWKRYRDSQHRSR